MFRAVFVAVLVSRPDDDGKTLAVPLGGPSLQPWEKSHKEAGAE